MTGPSPSLDELNAIMNLERQEAFDDQTSELSDHDNETPEEKLMKIIDQPLPGIPKEKQDLFKRSQAARKKSSRARYSYIASGGGTVTTNRFEFDSDPLDPQKEEWRQTLNRSLGGSANESAGIRRISRSKSPGGGPNNNDLEVPRKTSIRRLGHQRRSSARSLTMDGTESLTSTDTRNTTNSRNTTSERRGRRSKNSGHSRSSPTPTSVSSLNDSIHDHQSSVSSSDYLEVPTQDGKPPVPRKIRRSSRAQPEDGKPQSRQSLRGRRGSRDAQAARSNSRDAQGNRAKSEDGGNNRKSLRKSTSRRRMASFEQAWEESPGNGDQSTDPLPKRDSATPKRRSKPQGDVKRMSFEQAWGEGEADNGHLLAGASIQPTLQRSMTSDTANKKRTKREKIFELQAKCDRYKKEWIEASNEKKKVRKELQDVQVSIVSLNMQIDTQKAETEILQKQLTDTVQKLMEAKKVQERERAEADETAQELEQSRMEYNTALSETRELRTRIDELEDSLSDKDKQIASLNHDLAESKKLIEELKVDLNHADDEGILLEKEVRKLEEELEAYKAAAQKDQEGGSGENLRKAQSDIEKRLHDEKERRLNEKQQKLEARIKEFEEQKEKAMQEQQERQKEMATLQMADSEKQKTRDAQRREMDSELNNRLKELEESNTSLKGRLKSEQLQTTVKLKQRDETIEQLTRNLAEMKKQLAQRDADPEGLVAMQREVEAAKAAVVSVQEDLVEAQRMNGMLEEEIDEFQSTSAELRGELEALENEKKQFATEMAKVKAKSDEWQRKSSEWTDKAFRWKDKAEYWEKVCRQIDPYYKEGSTQVPPEKNEDPQAMMLQAAVAKKRSSEAANNPGRWNQWFNRPAGGDEAESQAKIQELQEKNTSQAQLIKKLQSEIVRIQSSHKEETYTKQQQILQVQREMEAVELANTNLVKQLELARKLEHFAAKDLTTTL